MVIFSEVIFFNYWSLKPWIRIRICIQPKVLDPDLDEMNADPQPCAETKKHIDSQCHLQLHS